MWLFAAIGSYFINAGVYVADKFLLSKRIHSSIVYAFYVGIWSIFNFVILIFDPFVPTVKWLMIDLSAGALFLFTMVFWYKALHQSEATRVVPIVGSLVPVFSLLFSTIFLGTSLTKQESVAFAILALGGALISVRRTKLYFPSWVFRRVHEILGSVHARYRPTERLIQNSIISAFFFAAYYILMKYIYVHQPFIGSFVWSRLGTFLAVLAILLVPQWRQAIGDFRKDSSRQTNLFFFLAVRIAAALAFIGLNWAISLGEVAMINVLQGTQYIFLLIIVLILSVRYPKIYKEELGGEVMFQKIAGVILVSLGLYLLV
jgi:drug/metabolite transporter (DMT)-like permease